MIDEDVDTGELVHIIQLEQADATQLVQTLQQMMQGGARGQTAQVRITADSGSNSILLAGLPKDVAEIESYIGELEGKSVLIPELQIFRLKHASAMDVADTVSVMFSGGGGGGRRGGRGGSSMDAVTVTPDDYYNRLLVTANKRKMRQIEAVIEQLDVPVETGEGGVFADSSGRQLYFVTIYRGDPWDIAWDVQDMLPPEDKGGPVLDADWFGEYIKVRCRPSEIEQVVNLIREFEKRAHVEDKVVVRKFRGSMEEALPYLISRMGDDKLAVEYAPERQTVKSIVEPLWKEGELPPQLQKRREHGPEDDSRVKSTSHTDVRPFKLGLPVSVVLLGGDIDEALFDQDPPATQPARRRHKPEQPADAPDKLPPGVSTQGPKPGGVEPEDGEETSKKEKTRIAIQPDGSVIIYGAKNDVDEVEEVLDLLEEDLDVGEVIRIFEFKYGDVTAAAEVVNIMFNERQTIRLTPQQQQQQQQQQGRGRQDQQQGRDQQSNMLDQLRGMVGTRQTSQRGDRSDGRRVRIATDPGHNYLIIKCNEADLPEIKQLLRELDIPPGEVELKVFQLRNLDANEAAQNIKEVLGIAKAQTRRSGNTGRTAARGNAQEQLMEMLQQQMVSVPGVEGGAKVESVEIVPNSVTNSLMVSAPPEVMTIIENVIRELEDLEGRDVIGIYHHELRQAKVDDLLPLLQEVFSAVGGGGGGRAAGRRGGGGGSNPGAMGTVTISGDPRSNTIIFTAEAKDVRDCASHRSTHAGYRGCDR